MVVIVGETVPKPRVVEMALVLLVFDEETRENVEVSGFVDFKGETKGVHGGGGRGGRETVTVDTVVVAVVLRLFYSQVVVGKDNVFEVWLGGVENIRRLSFHLGGGE